MIPIVLVGHHVSGRKPRASGDDPIKDLQRDAMVG